MTLYASTGHLLLTPVDREAPARTPRLRELDLGERADPELDAFAQHVAETLQTPYAGINFMGEERQFFAGLHHGRDARGAATRPVPCPGTTATARTWSSGGGRWPWRTYGTTRASPGTRSWTAAAYGPTWEPR